MYDYLISHKVPLIFRNSIFFGLDPTCASLYTVISKNPPEIKLYDTLFMFISQAADICFAIQSNKSWRNLCLHFMKLQPIWVHFHLWDLEPFIAYNCFGGKTPYISLLEIKADFKGDPLINWSSCFIGDLPISMYEIKL